MLQKVRDNMKGSLVAAVVFLLFIVPLVLTGLGDGSFLGSVAGTDAASVEGEEITKAELRRAVYMRKQRLLSQDGVDPDAEFLQDENLTGPVLESLTQRAALVVAAKKGGLGAADSILDAQILQRPDFQVDGKFDRQTYQRLLSNFAYTPTTYKEALAGDYLLSQQSQGISLSSFSTEEELAKLVSLIQQKRSFYTVKIPKATVESTISVSDEDVAAYYEENSNNFIEEEKVVAQYIELSVADIAQTVEVSEDKVREIYDQEIADFDATEQYEIAHLLVEEKDGQADVIAEIAGKIKDGQAFDALVSEYSDDVGSKESGGSLGVMTKGVFPEAFENAVYTLEQDQISDPVVTDAGTHFIKVIEKTVNEAPTYESREASIIASLKQVEAEEIYVASLDRLEELTFSADNLEEAAQVLNLEVQETAAFSRTSGTGLASRSEFRDVAFSDEVLANGYNSKRIMIGETRSVVLRKSSHTPSRVKALDEVKDELVKTLTDSKIEDELNLLATALKDKLAAGGSAEELAKENSYEFKSFDKVERTASEAGFQVSSKVFTMSKGDSVAIDSMVDREGSHIVLGLLEVLPGKRSDMAEQQFKGLSAQLQIQGADFEAASYESQIVSTSDIDIY